MILIELGDTSGDIPAEAGEIVAESCRRGGLAGADRRTCIGLGCGQVLTGATVFDDPACDQSRLTVCRSFEAQDVNCYLVVNLRSSWPWIVLKLLGIQELGKIFGKDTREVLVERLSPSFLRREIELVGRGSRYDLEAAQIVGKLDRSDADR
ncbi:MAG TPA: hypothetical protein VJX23_15925 [Candidatus Binataceae bacterium]|nr:hypothetical protein [Candidatus Binataceae bacterium]